jgi:hypothetical protein
MTTAIKGPPEEQLATLEAMYRDLRKDLDQIRSAVAGMQSKKFVRLARITNAPISGDNTYAIMFLDGTFTEAAGNQTPTYSNRQNAAAGFAHNIITSPSTPPAQNDVILVWRWSDRWWFERG